MSILGNLFDGDGGQFYKVMITGADLGTSNKIIAYLPEKFSITSSATFESRFTAGLGNQTLQTVSNGLQASTGVSLVTKKMSLATWTASSPIEFQLPLQFNAYSDPYNEVHKPLANLLSLTRPSASDTPFPQDSSTPLGKLANLAGAGAISGAATVGQKLIRGPGPTYSEPNRNTYTLTVGNIAVFLNMLIISVNVEMDSLITKDGYCISAQADVTVMSSSIMLKEDIQTAFKFGVPLNSINQNNSANSQFNSVSTSGSGAP